MFLGDRSIEIFKISKEIVNGNSVWTKYEVAVRILNVGYDEW